MEIGGNDGLQGTEVKYEIQHSMESSSFAFFFF